MKRFLISMALALIMSATIANAFALRVDDSAEQGIAVVLFYIEKCDQTGAGFSAGLIRTSKWYEGKFPTEMALRIEALKKQLRKELAGLAFDDAITVWCGVTKTNLDRSTK